MRLEDAVRLLGLMANTQQVDVESNRPGYSEGQLPEEGIAGVDVPALTVLRDEQPALLRRLAGIVAGEQGRKMRVPLVHEVQAAFLHPAVEILLGDRIGVVKYGALRVKNGDRRLLHGNALA